MTESRHDDALMLAYSHGDTGAFEALYGRYRKGLYRYFLYACGQRDQADELFQDTWSRIIDNRRRFRAEDHTGQCFKRYLFRIAHNLLVDHWRRLGRNPTEPAGDSLDNFPDSDQHAPEASYSRAELRDRLFRALESLSLEQRETFLLQQEAGLSREDIAEQTRVGVETVKSRLRYAVARLRKTLRPDLEASGP